MADCSRYAATLLALLLLAAWPEPAEAQVDGVSYTLRPTGQYVFGDSDLLGGDESGLEGGLLYGGQLGLGFGQYLTVSGEYLLGEGLLGAGFETTDDFENQDVDLKRYGGQVRLNLGGFDFGEAGGFQPFVTGGAGVIEFDPDGRSTTENIYAKVGAGITFSALDRLTLSLSGEGMSYRYTPLTTFGVGSDETQTVYVPSARASVAIFLGGERPGQVSALDEAIRDQFSGGLGGIRIFAEPFYGRIEFNDALKTGSGGDIPKDQNVAGINAGIQLGPQVGVRGFYWRGVSGQDGVFDEFAEDVEDVGFYGGELNLRFGSVFSQQSFAPFLILGGGYMDFYSDYDFGTPDDRYFASGGVGVDFPLSSSLILQGAARSLFMSNTEAEDISTTDQIYGNLMYSAGLKFSFGGGDSRSPQEILAERRAAELADSRERTQAEIAEARTSSNAAIRRLQSRIDSLEAVRVQQESESEEEEQLQEEVQQLEAEVQEEQRDQQVREQEAQQQQMEAQQQMREQQQGQRAAPQGSNLSGQTITVPVPERGEIYIRFGEGANSAPQVETVYGPPTVVQGGAAPQVSGGQAGPTSGRDVSAQDIERIVRQEMRRADADGRDMTAEDIAAIVRDEVRSEVRSRGDVDLNTRFLEEQLDEERQERRELRRELNRLRNDLEEELDEQDEELSRRTSDRPREIIVDEGGEDGETTTTVVGGSGYTPNSFVPFAGYTVGDANRFLIGVRGNYGDDGSNLDLLGFRFAPEAAIGFGDGLSFDLVANGIVDVNQLDRLVSVPDALQPYAGVGLGLTTETGLGVNLLLGTEYEIGNGAAFGEFSTLDFFEYNRFLIGYRTRF